MVSAYPDINRIPKWREPNEFDPLCPEAGPSQEVSAEDSQTPSLALELSHQVSFRLSSCLSWYSEDVLSHLQPKCYSAGVDTANKGFIIAHNQDTTTLPYSEFTQPLALGWLESKKRKINHGSGCKSRQWLRYSMCNHSASEYRPRT